MEPNDLTYTPSTLDDIYYISTFARPEDAREALASSGLSIYESMSIYWWIYINKKHPSDWMLTAKLNGKPCAIFGITSEGFIWLMGTKELEKHRLLMTKEARDKIDIFSIGHKALWTWCDDRNQSHKIFLERVLGFQRRGEGFFGKDKSVKFITYVRGERHV